MLKGKGKGKGKAAPSQPPGLWMEKGGKSAGKGFGKMGFQKGYQFKGGKGFSGKGKGKPWNSNPTGSGYQGHCYTCGKIGHKTIECGVMNLQTGRINGVEESQGNESQIRQANSVELPCVWNLCSVTKVTNQFAALGEPDGIDHQEFPTIKESGTNTEPRRTNFRRAPKGKKGWKILDDIPENEAIEMCIQDAHRQRTEEGTIKEICVLESRGEPIKINLGFQVTDVKKPLISVRRIVERDNIVNFGPEQGDNYILNRKSGNKILLRPNGKGSYIMDVEFVGGGPAEIIVDSGAEESVCPKDWGEQFGLNAGGPKMRFRNASGGTINHYGHREVIVTAPF